MSPAVQPRRTNAALLLGAVLAGWWLADALLVTAVGAPDWLATLAPRSLALVAAAALLGLLADRVRGGLVALALLATLAALVTQLTLPGAADAARWLPRVVLASTLLALAGRRLGLGFALCGGLASGAALHAYRLGLETDATAGLLIGGALLVAVGALPRVRLRAALRGLVFLVLAGGALLGYRDANALRRPDLPPPSAAAPDAPNLLFVVLDTVRADHLAPYGSARVTTPHLDRLAHEGATLYRNARSTSSWTLPSHASLFTGLYPDEHGATRPRVRESDTALTLQAWPAQRLREDVPTLAETLRARGYRTAAFAGNTSFLRFEYGLDRGFEHYDDRPRPYLPRLLTLGQLAGGGARVGFLPYREAERVADLALAWLERTGAEPFFLFLNFMDAHLPCIPPAPYDRAFGDAAPMDPRKPEPELLPLLSDRELLHVDAELGRVLAALETSGRLENTAVVVTSDHGEAFGEHGFTAHGWNLYEEVVRVPLVVKAVGQREPAVREEPVFGVDVARLALEALGEPGSARRTDGVIGQVYLTEKLREIWRERGAWPVGDQLAWLEGSRKFLVDPDGRVLAFDLREDPRETLPLPLSDGERERARARAFAWWEAHPPVESHPVEGLDATEAQRLRDLGYAGDEE